MKGYAFAFVACVFGIGLGTVHAETAALGDGTHLCAEFNKDYAADPGTAGATYFAWAQAFMTGLNVADMRRSGQSVDLQSKPSSDQESEIRRYCSTHPDFGYLKAVLVLFDTLPKNAPIKRGK